MFNCVVNHLGKDCIPFTNLISLLSDSAGYIWGSKSGFETLLKAKCPNLVIVGGDSCHDIHNIVKKFGGFFEKYVEYLMDDIYNDLKYSV